MGKADVEIQAITSHLTRIYRKNTNCYTGLTHRPYGMDWIELERNVYRLLILRGIINMGDMIPQDPWELFLSEYAPADTRRPACEKMLQSCQSYPRSILLTSPVTQQQQQDVVEPERHIRFVETPVPNRMRAPRRRPTPTPGSRS